jgi:uncharacterized protein
MPLPEWKFERKIVIGMVHLRPLPGSPRFAGTMQSIVLAAVRDARALAEGGVHGVMVENFGDVPFHPGAVPPHTVAAMTACAAAVRATVDLPIGINVLRNDGRSALAVALACGASFVRVNVLCGARVADQGILQGQAHDLLRDRVALGASHVRILADVDVKHSAPLADRGVADEVDDTVRRGLADGVIVSGAGTGKSTSVGKLHAVKSAAGTTPVFVGSGITAESINEYAPHADGFIVGTSFKEDGDVDAPIDVERVRALMAQVRRL